MASIRSMLCRVRWLSEVMANTYGFGVQYSREWCQRHDLCTAAFSYAMATVGPCDDL